MYQFLEGLLTLISPENIVGTISFYLLNILLGLYLLTKGGDWLCDHCSNLALLLGVPSVIIGLTIVSVATSAPELFTSIAALRSNSQGLILGNIIGSNIANIGLILGICILIKPIDTRKSITTIQISLLMMLTLFLCTLLAFGKSRGLGFWPGVFLLVFIFAYLIYLTWEGLKNRNGKTEKDNTINKRKVVISIIMVFLATTALWTGSDTLVFGSKKLALIVGVPQELIGFSLIAIGTSLPEMAASISLIKKAEVKMLLGNILGSNIFNIALVGGVAGVLGPIIPSTPKPWIDYFSLTLVTVIFCLWLRGRLLNRPDGIFLLILYLAATTATWLFNG